MDGHDAKIHNDQCSGNAGRLSRTMPDQSEGDSSKSQLLDTNHFFSPTNNIPAEHSCGYNSSCKYVGRCCLFTLAQICTLCCSLGSRIHRQRRACLVLIRA